MRCNDCKFYYKEVGHDQRRRPACRKGLVPYIDTFCTFFEEYEICDEVIDYIMYEMK